MGSQHVHSAGRLRLVEDGQPESGPEPTTGNFAETLDAAIQASGLSLERIRYALAAHGVRISATTLSYWRRGRSQPERASSMPVVRLLEEILALPGGALTTRLGPPRPRGRYVTGQPAGSTAGQPALGLGVEELWPGERWLAEVFEELEAKPGDDLERLSVHDTFLVDAGRGEVVLRMNQVVRATASGVSRCLVIHRSDEDTDELPRIGSVRHARLGRVRQQQQVGIVVAELLLDVPLGIGDTAVFEYEVRLAANSPATCYGRLFAVPVRQYVLQVQFAPGATPVYCYRFDRCAGADTDQARRQLWLGPSATAHLVSLDQPPGQVGIRWEWD